MVKAFARGGWEELSRLWKDKKLSTAACASMTFKLFDATFEDVVDLLDTLEIDEYFSEFLSVCRYKGYEVYVLSDGYDFNISTILDRYGIDIVYYSNRLIYDRDKGFDIECPYQNKSCEDAVHAKKI